MSSKSVILVAADESDQSLNAFKFYLKNFYDIRHSVVLLHVIEKPHHHTPQNEATNGVGSDLPESDKKKAQTVFQKFTDLAAQKAIQIQVRQLVETGARVGPTIVEVTSRERASCLVLGTYAKTSIRHKVVPHRCTSDHVLRHVECPVLVNRK